MESRDILRDLGPLALGSRLKRLSDWLLTDAAKIYRDSEHPHPTGQFPLIAALDRYGPMTVNDAAAVLGVSQPAATRTAAEAAKFGLVEAETSAGDRRVRTLSLTEVGRQSVAQMKLELWPRVEAAARELLRGTSGAFLRDVAALEARLAERSLLERYADRDLR
ncbi:MAG: MarR family winged helix-turn-helix transcriptional regulator, partial [Planctomycetota bacterium]